MSQKELLYLEDAIGHEDSIIAILSDSIDKLEDEELVSFMENELLKHQDERERLMNFLKEEAND